MFANSSLTARYVREVRGDMLGLSSVPFDQAWQRQPPACFPACLCVLLCSYKKKKKTYKEISVGKDTSQ